MNTTRIFSAVAATALGAGLVLTATTANAAPGPGPGQGACTNLGGSYAGDADGWWCTYPAAASPESLDEPTLIAVCDGEYWATVLDDGIGSISFRCAYAIY